MRTPPNSAIPHQGVEDREQLPHARHQRYLLRLAGGEQPLVELLDGGVVAGGDQGTHVEGDSNRGSAAPHLALTTPLAGIPVEGGDSHQSREALVGELAQFGQFGEQRPRQDRADTGNALEERLVLLEKAALASMASWSSESVRSISFSSHFMCARIRLARASSRAIWRRLFSAVSIESS